MSLSRAGQPASYRHPRTGEPYATIEAYKTLQRRYEEAQAAKAAAAEAAAEQRTLLTQRQGVLIVSGDAQRGSEATHHLASQSLPAAVQSLRLPLKMVGLVRSKT